MDRISRQNALTSRRPCGRPDRRAIRAAALSLILGLAFNVVCAALVAAQDESSKTESDTSAVPIPPARPPALVAPNAAVVATPLQAPEQPSTLAPPKASAAAVPPQPVDPKATAAASAPVWKPGKLLALPPYTRARMHKCAVEWQNMKANGTTAEKIWFTFAQSCLAQR